MRLGLGLFITGTDTEIGKTFVSCSILARLAQQEYSTIALKPIAAGANQKNGHWHNEDVDQLLHYANTPISTKDCSTFLFKTPASPHIAATQENRSIEINEIVQRVQVARQQADFVLVEGVGGFCVPISETQDTADLAAALDLPILLVVGMRLGCLNHALLTAQAIQQKKLRLMGWVANCIDPNMSFLSENINTLQYLFESRYQAPLIGQIKYLQPADPKQAALSLNISQLLKQLF